MNNFEELEAWKSAREVRKAISKLAKTFPREGRSRLADQIIRSARSVTANIAEGFGRYHYQENVQYCRQARGSLTETLDHLICAHDEGFIDDETFRSHRSMIGHAWKILNGYIAYLKKAAEANKK